MSPLPDDDTTKYCVSFDIAKSIAQNITQEIAKEFTKREPGVLPKHVQGLIHKIDAATIERMVVVRTPVEECVGHLMQVLSIGKYRETIKESYYDKVSTRYSAFASIFFVTYVSSLAMRYGTRYIFISILLYSLTICNLVSHYFNSLGILVPIKDVSSVTADKWTVYIGEE